MKALTKFTSGAMTLTRWGSEDKSKKAGGHGGCALSRRRERGPCTDI